MEKGLIGIQMSTIKKKVDELGAYETLKACAEMGYHCMEVSQIPMTAENVSGMRKACREFGIKIAANTAALEPMAPGMPGEYLVSDFDKIVEDCKALDTNMLRIGMLPITCMGSREKAVDFVMRWRSAWESMESTCITTIIMWSSSNTMASICWTSSGTTRRRWALSWTSTGFTGAVRTLWSSSADMRGASACCI